MRAVLLAMATSYALTRLLVRLQLAAATAAYLAGWNDAAAEHEKRGESGD